MAEIQANTYAPLDAASLYTLIHGTPRPGSAHHHSNRAHATEADRYEPPRPAPSSRHRLPDDCTVDLENLQRWRSLARLARAVDPIRLSRESADAHALRASTPPEVLQRERVALRRVLREQLERAPHHPSRRVSKIKHCVRSLRINLRASGWPGGYMPARHSQYEWHKTADWLEQLKAWDRAITKS